MKRFLLVNGEKFEVKGMSFNQNGSIGSINVYDDFSLRTFTDINSNLEGGEKVDFSTCYIEEGNEAIERVKALLDKIDNDLDEVAHMAIPTPGEEVDLEELQSTWTLYHIMQACRNGVEKALEALENK